MKRPAQRELFTAVEVSVRFVKPTVAEVAAYCAERKNGIDPELWHDYYESNGWRVGRNPMKDWRAAVRTWEKNGHTNGHTQQRRRVVDNGAAFREVFGDDH